MRSLFESTADHLTAQLSADEVLLLEFAGEGSDFVRFNGGKVRQAGHVDQAELWLDLIRGRRHAASPRTGRGRPAPSRTPSSVPRAPRAPAPDLDGELDGGRDAQSC